MREIRLSGSEGGEGETPFRPPIIICASRRIHIPTFHIPYSTFHHPAVSDKKGFL